MTTTDINAQPGSKMPSHIAYHVQDSKGKAYFTKIGAAWPHKDGKGFNIQLGRVLPLDGRITVRVASEKKI